MVAVTDRKPDDTEVWRDSGIEIFLSANETSDFIYQFMFNSVGAKADLKNSLYRVDAKFNSGFEVKTYVVSGMRWTAEVRIPRKDMPELAGKTAIVGNFTRHRVLEDKKVDTEFYAWHPMKHNIPEDFGNIRLDGRKPDGNLIKTGDFDKPVHAKRFIDCGDWAEVGSSKYIIQDHEFFITKGVSLRLEPGSSAVRQSFKMTPGKLYKVSFFVRTEKLMPGLRVIFRFGGDPAQPIYVLGNYKDYIRDTVDWYRVERTFRAPEKFGTIPGHGPFIDFTIGESTGKCWIDHVELHEIAEPEKHLDGAYLDAVNSDERGGMREER